MPIDLRWLQEVRKTSDIATRDTLTVDGVEIELPKPNARGRKERFRDWQRRILPDLMPDSVNADAAERTPFRLVYALTTAEQTGDVDGAFAGELGPLEPLFRARTLGKRQMTLAFHVLAVRGAKASERDTKGYTDKTLILLFRRADGSLNEGLLRELIEQFRRDPQELDLAQRTLLDALRAGWNPTQEPSFILPEGAKKVEVPFDPSACELFQEDIRSLIDAELPAADFFSLLNRLLAFHLGLYQPRVAALLNPQMDLLYQDLAAPDPRNVRDLEDLAGRFKARHPFTAAARCRAPDPDQRPVGLQTPCRKSFELMSVELSKFHFNVLTLVQLRRLTEAWLTHHWETYPQWRALTLRDDQQNDLAAATRGPVELMTRLHDSPEFRQFINRSLTALCVRFILNQITESNQSDEQDNLEKAESGLHGLRSLYERYNSQSSRNATASRAYRQGAQVSSSLLQQTHYGILRARSRVGAYFEMGAGLLPLLLLTSIGAGREKRPVNHFWQRLESYGLGFDAEERERVMARLRDMGVYERFSDAGEAAYVRNLLTSSRED
jgi:hypothetical protein